MNEQKAYGYRSIYNMQYAYQLNYINVTATYENDFSFAVFIWYRQFEHVCSIILKHLSMRIFAK